MTRTSHLRAFTREIHVAEIRKKVSLYRSAQSKLRDDPTLAKRILFTLLTKPTLSNDVWSVVSLRPVHAASLQEAQDMCTGNTRQRQNTAILHTILNFTVTSGINAMIISVGVGGCLIDGLHIFQYVVEHFIALTHLVYSIEHSTSSEYLERVNTQPLIRIRILVTTAASEWW